MSEEKIRSIEDVESQLLEKVIRMAQQTGSSLTQIVIYEIIRGLKAKGLERVSILTNALLLVTFDEAERETLNKIKLISGRLVTAEKNSKTTATNSIILPPFCFSEIRYLEWLENVGTFYVDTPLTLEKRIEEDEKRKAKFLEEFRKKNPNATKEADLLAKALCLDYFHHPPLELIINDFVVWADNIILQKISRILSGGGESEDKVVNGE
ncbi:MAG: hypothetical protein ACPLZG_10380 [Thermoproteota archaeon]|jgi:hypothetical protein